MCYITRKIGWQRQALSLRGSDTLGYLSIEHVQQLAIHSKCGFCTGCFTGKYPVAPPTETMDIVYDKPLSQSKTNKKL